MMITSLRHFPKAYFPGAPRPDIWSRAELLSIVCAVFCRPLFRRHVGRPMKNRGAWPKKKDAGNIVIREFPAIPFGERSEIGRWHLQCGSEGALALWIHTVTGGAILFEHDAAGRRSQNVEQRSVEMTQCVSREPWQPLF
jgi:hypothetical protein